MQVKVLNWLITLAIVAFLFDLLFPLMLIYQIIDLFRLVLQTFDYILNISLHTTHFYLSLLVWLRFFKYKSKTFTIWQATILPVYKCNITGVFNVLFNLTLPHPGLQRPLPGSLLHNNEFNTVRRYTHPIQKISSIPFTQDVPSMLSNCRVSLCSFFVCLASVCVCLCVCLRVYLLHCTLQISWGHSPYSVLLAVSVLHEDKSIGDEEKNSGKCRRKRKKKKRETKKSWCATNNICLK